MEEAPHYYQAHYGYSPRARTSSRQGRPRSASSRAGDLQQTILRSTSTTNSHAGPSTLSYQRHMPNKNEPPYFVVKPRNEQAVEGADAVFTARCNANSSYRVVWVRKGRIIADSAKYVIETQDGLHVLQVRKCDGSDAGNYKCLVECSTGSAMSKFSLSVVARHLKSFPTTSYDK